MRAGRIMSDGKTTAATRFWRVGFSPKRAHASVIRAQGRKRKTAKSMSHAVVFPERQHVSVLTLAKPAPSTRHPRSEPSGRARRLKATFHALFGARGAPRTVSGTHLSTTTPFYDYD